MTFTNSGDIIYAVGLEQEMANPDEDTFGSSFKTFDASDYSLIGDTMSPFVFVCVLIIDFFLIDLYFFSHNRDEACGAWCEPF